ncbi:MAG: invasion associated locus B family protein [Salipiger thiooxidans]|uniref:invasion associated locus B family protein n=1 Tax=Salipiger thiooxidans TaxID=282683 RepID=UPI001CD7B68E|nr:invasion associated locus B family protein [Salipiger thiooxidans]MCA0847627.1 invasion associated locus B family protein [Salipiger thiooxidans]
MTRSRNVLWALPLLASLAAAPVLAQDTAEQPAADTEAPAAGAAPVGGDLTLGETDGGAPDANGEQPETYIAATHGDWQLQCLRVPEGTDAEDPCQMYQLLKDQNGGNVAEVSMFRLSNGGQVTAGGTFIVPLETLLTQKLTISVDGGQAKRYDFSFCTQVGCYARVGFTADDVARFKGGKSAKVTIVPALAPDQQVELDMSLSGFTAAYDASSALRQ